MGVVFCYLLDQIDRKMIREGKTEMGRIQGKEGWWMVVLLTMHHTVRTLRGGKGCQHFLSSILLNVDDLKWTNTIAETGTENTWGYPCKFLALVCCALLTLVSIKITCLQVSAVPSWVRQGRQHPDGQQKWKWTQTQEFKWLQQQ